LAPASRLQENVNAEGKGAKAEARGTSAL
jgi:hypothetical protein